MSDAVWIVWDETDYYGPTLVGIYVTEPEARAVADALTEPGVYAPRRDFCDTLPPYEVERCEVGATREPWATLRAKRATAATASGASLRP